MGLDESMYMTAAFEMNESGDYLVPSYNGEHFFDKPPLAYWLEAGSFSFFDFFFQGKRLSDANQKFIPFDGKLFAMRFPISFIALLFVVTICIVSKKLFSMRASIYAGYAFAFCLLTAALGKMAIIDMILSFFIFLSLIIFILTYTNRLKKSYIIIAFISLSLAIMAKGPIALGIVGFPVLAFLIYRKNLKFMFDRHTLLGFLLFLCLALPWFFICQINSGGTFFHEFFIHQNVQRALGQDFDHNYSPFFYLGIIFIGMAPWSMYLIPAVISNFKKRNSNNLITEQFLCFWIISVFLMFTCINSKLPGYIFPIFAPAALIIGKYLENIKFNKTNKIMTISATFLSVILGIGFIIVPYTLSFQSVYVKIIFAVMGGWFIYFAIKSLKDYMKKRNPAEALGIQMAGFLVLFVIAMPIFALNSNTLKDEMDQRSDFLGTTGYVLAKDFNLRNLPNNVTVIAFGMHPQRMNFPLLFERKVIIVNTKEELEKTLDENEYYFLIMSKRKMKEEGVKKLHGKLIENDKYFGKKNGIFIDYNFLY